MRQSPADGAYRERVDELADSALLLNDQGGLRRRLADDGYLFFRGLLPETEVRAAGLAVVARLRDGGWVDDRAIPSDQPRAVNPMDALSDPSFRAALVSVGFNRIPYLPPLRAVVRSILGSTAFSYPVKVLRAVYPERPEARPRGRYVHYDYGGGRRPGHAYELDPADGHPGPDRRPGGSAWRAPGPAASAPPAQPVRARLGDDQL